MSGAMACACRVGGCGGACAPNPDADRVASVLRFGHAAIRDRMVAALGRERALDGLGTRDPTDPAIALIDAWAGALHVLGFAAARLADDSDLAIGSDGGALLELTRLIGYAPRPAISATTLMGLTVDPNATADAVVPAGTQIVTIPREKELPLPFETSAALPARSAWNALTLARVTAVQPVTAATTELLIAGIDVTATLGDAVLARIDAGTLLFARFVDVVRFPDPVTPRAVLKITAGIPVASGFGPQMGEVVVLGVRTSAFGALAPDYNLVKSATSNAAVAQLLTPLAAGTAPAAAPAAGAVPGAAVGFEERFAGLRAETVNETLSAALAALALDDWPDLKMPANGTADLSSIVKEALPGRTVLFAAGTNLRIGQIVSVTEAFRAGFALSGAVTRITPTGVPTSPTDANSFNGRVRDTAIHVETQRLRLLAQPDPAETVPPAAAPDRLTVVGTVPLPAGRLIALVGKDASNGNRQVESATVLSTAPTGGDTVVTFNKPLHNRFLATGLTISANVVSASHGRTPPNPPELLGSSDARRMAPVYPLSTGPVTHVADTSARGYTAALEVRVSGRLYQPVERFFDLADDRAWRPRQRRDGGFEVQFAGRLPTATNNVTAAYRVGGGAAGNVEAGRISMMMTPVLGVSKAENLTAAEGGTDAAGPDDVRDAGDTITLLDRVVALADHERFARAFRGVGKALATELPRSLRRTVYVTIAGADGLPPSTALTRDLGDALAKVTIPGRLVRIVGFVATLIHVTVSFAHDPALIRADVEAAVRAALLASFGAGARAFGQALYTSELLAVTQGVPGVLAATATIEGGIDPAAAQPPRLVNGTLELAGLVSINDSTLTLTEMAP